MIPVTAGMKRGGKDECQMLQAGNAFRNQVIFWTPKTSKMEQIKIRTHSWQASFSSTSSSTMCLVEKGAIVPYRQGL